MALLPKRDGHTDGTRARVSVAMFVKIAMDVAASRVTNPDAWPLIPKEDVVGHLTRKILADLVELGFEPDGWVDAYPRSGWVD